MTEALKWRAVRGDKQPIYFWRDNIGNEIDLLLKQDGGITLVEIKSGQTCQDEWQRALQVVERHLGFTARKAVLYGGDMAQARQGAQVLPWGDLRFAD